MRTFITAGDALILIVVENPIGEARQHLDNLFGRREDYAFEALCARADNKPLYGLFFGPGVNKIRDIRRVAHEVFHLTMRIQEHRAGKPWDNSMHEDTAYLNEYLLHAVLNAMGWNV